MFSEMVDLEASGNPHKEEGKIGEIWDDPKTKLSTGHQLVCIRRIA